MQCRVLSVVVLLTAALAACTGSEPRIDGSSPDAFAKSHKHLMESLSLADQARLALAEMVICTAAAPKPADQAGTVPPQMVPLVAVRSQLDGRTFNEILEYSRSLHVKVKVGFLTEPPSNNRSRGP